MPYRTAQLSMEETELKEEKKEGSAKPKRSRRSRAKKPAEKPPAAAAQEVKQETSETESKSKEKEPVAVAEKDVVLPEKPKRSRRSRSRNKSVRQDNREETAVAGIDKPAEVERQPVAEVVVLPEKPVREERPADEKPEAGVKPEEKRSGRNRRNRNRRNRNRDREPGTGVPASPEVSINPELLSGMSAAEEVQTGDVSDEIMEMLPETGNTAAVQQAEMPVPQVNAEPSEDRSQAMSTHHLALSFQERQRLTEFKQKSRHVCHYCGKQIHHREDLTVDHVMPVSRGGVNDESNFAIACQRCNSEKDDMNLEEYLLFKEKQKDRFDTFEVSGMIQRLQEMFSELTAQSEAINSEYQQAVRTVERVENEIAGSTFNASTGYRLAKELKAAINRRNALKVQQDAVNSINSFVGNSKKQLAGMGERIFRDVMGNFTNTLRQEVISELYPVQTEETSVAMVEDMIMDDSE